MALAGVGACRYEKEEIVPLARRPEGMVPGATLQYATAFELEVYPHGHGYHTACDPVTGTCALGVGFGTSIQFDVYVTAFYGPVPDGYTLLA